MNLSDSAKESIIVDGKKVNTVCIIPNAFRLILDFNVNGVDIPVFHDMITDSIYITIGRFSDATGLGKNSVSRSISKFKNILEGHVLTFDDIMNRINITGFDGVHLWRTPPTDMLNNEEWNEYNIRNALYLDEFAQNFLALRGKSEVCIRFAKKVAELLVVLRKQKNLKLTNDYDIIENLTKAQIELTNRQIVLSVLNDLDPQIKTAIAPQLISVAFNERLSLPKPKYLYMREDIARIINEAGVNSTTITAIANNLKFILGSGKNIRILDPSKCEIRLTAAKYHTKQSNTMEGLANKLTAKLVPTVFFTEEAKNEIIDEYNKNKHIYLKK